MYAVEFEAPIHNGIVKIPSEYSELYERQNAKFCVLLQDEHLKASGKKNKKKLDAISIDTREFKFDREEANER